MHKIISSLQDGTVRLLGVEAGLYLAMNRFSQFSLLLQTSYESGKVPKKNRIFLWSFAKPVPPKHVLHLVWSPYVIYTAIRTALKVACKARILGKRKSISKNKKVKFWNGTKCKICFTHL